MLRKKSSFSSRTSSPTPSPIPARPNTPVHSLLHHESSGVRRALSSLQNALHPARRLSSDEKRIFALSDQQSHLSANNYRSINTNPTKLYTSIINNRRIPLSHSNGTSDSLYTANSTMTPLTTDDDSSSTTSHPLRLQRPRRSSRSGSLPSSPLGSFLSNGSSVALSTHSTHITETASECHEIEDEDDASDNLHDSPNGAALRVRHLEHEASYSGYLAKFSSRTFFSRKQWKRRYFILNQSSLHCFKSSDPQHPLLESLKLCADTIICVTDMFSGKRYCLQITSPGEKNWYVLADTAADMSSWLRELKGTVLRIRGLPVNSRPGTHYSDSSEMSDLSSSSAAMTDSIPAIPHIPSQHDGYVLIGRTPSPAPSSRSSHLSHPPQRLDLYQFANMTDFTQLGTPKLLESSSNSEQEIKWKKDSSSSSVHIPGEYASFGTVMEQADALPLERNEHLPTPISQQKRLSESPYAATIKSKIPYSTSDSNSNNNNDSNRNSTNSSNGRRISIVTDQPEIMMKLPRRSSQRLSPVSPRPMSPNRNSPRSSLVVSPPPRSIHRPSISVRQSAQIIPLQMTGRSLSPTPGQSANILHSSLARSTSFRGSMLTGSLQERSYRSPSRPTIITDYHSRPTSPTPIAFSSAPTSPLPEPPRSESPVMALKHSLSLSSNGSSQRIAIVPRHHDPERLIKHRPSKSRNRSRSQELALSVRLNDVQISMAKNRASTPSPRLSAIVTTNDLNDDALPTPPISPSGIKMNGDTVFKHFPLLHNGGLVLPPPPTGQQPDLPTSTATSNDGSINQSGPSSHKHSLSTSSLRSVSSSSSIGSFSTVSHGGLNKKNSTRESMRLSARLSSLVPIPLESTVFVPNPPQTALPPIPNQSTSPTSLAEVKDQNIKKQLSVETERMEELFKDTEAEAKITNANESHDLTTADTKEGGDKSAEVSTPESKDGDRELKAAETAVDVPIKEHVATCIQSRPLGKQTSTFEMILEEEEGADHESVTSKDISSQRANPQVSGGIIQASTDEEVDATNT
ncbi:hypothetical protein BX616_002364 [Lobosporangium transversale]|uniref:PH domain-containing protein n=1 Tax=Lobosporangium transversale TaxID=64571 RepID=A0A1Y2GLP1_9FUNG|nr:hypothetical protein BCR41DRAFT_93159 [Lobosporangium transversale]KAF9901149.1 hypothetical protein BX616_002364 [Lobosporangium transversale]ORZ13341.1 hypothetical protein BCR41DRAFT_93159 [Lobosporangium transversale]|eukprot:XP_021880422.1 hypothetical protein BCR41DRAFT_93159 [Lobosporangium transversale]